MIYFVANGNGLIKIGYSTNVENRMKDFRVGSPGLILIDKMPGNRGHERALHLLLASYRVEGEWFRDNDHVRSAIASAVANGIEEVKAKRPGPVSLDDTTINAQRLVNIILKCRPQTAFNEVEEAFDIPPSVIYRMKYKPDNRLTVSAYVSLLRAGRAAISEAIRDLADDLNFIDDIERTDADSQNHLIDLENKVERLRNELARLKQTEK